MIACVDSDAENIFIALTARELNPGVAIVARSSDEHSESKLLRAGADRVISPYKSSGAEMARLALHPQVSGAIEVADDHRLEEISVSPGCPGSGKRIDEIRGGAFIVGVKHADGSFEPQPPPESVLVRRRRPDGARHAAHDGAPRSAVRARRAVGMNPTEALRQAVTSMRRSRWWTRRATARAR